MRGMEYVHCSTQPLQLRLKREEPASICVHQRLRSISANGKNKKQNPEIMRIKCNSTYTLSNVTLNKKKNTTAITLPLECFYRATELERRQRGSYLFDVSDEVVQRVGRSVSLWTNAQKRSHVKVKLISLENSYEKLQKDQSYEI